MSKSGDSRLFEQWSTRELTLFKEISKGGHTAADRCFISGKRAAGGARFHFLEIFERPVESKSFSRKVGF